LGVRDVDRRARTQSHDRRRLQREAGMSENVQGRWTIYRDGLESYVHGPLSAPGGSQPGRRIPVEVPVVPCDEAAVERAAKALQDAEAFESFPGTGGAYLAAARAALRAAGADDNNARQA
jgi:hypothetical protein